MEEFEAPMEGFATTVGGHGRVHYDGVPIRYSRTIHASTTDGISSRRDERKQA